MPVYKDDKTKTWYYVVEIGNAGNRKRRKKRGFKSKGEAKKAMDAIQNELNQGEYIEPSKTLFKDHLVQYLEIKKVSVKDSTYQTYKWLINEHIISGLGDFTLSDLNPKGIQSFYNEILLKNKLSSENVQKIHSLIKNSLNLAKRWGMIKNNPAELVDRPKATKKEITVWTKDEARKFLSVAEEDRLFIAFHLALTTGMRQGEILGLRWKDINIKNKKIHIQQTLAHDAKSFSSTKTLAGQRSVVMADETVPILLKQKELIEDDKLKAKDIYEDNDLVVCTNIGTPINPSNVVRSFRRLIKEAYVPVIRFHDLRHTHATHLLSLNVNPKIVSDRLGHANVRITLDTYSHLLPDMQKEAAETFSKAFFS